MSAPESRQESASALATLVAERFGVVPPTDSPGFGVGTDSPGFGVGTDSPGFGVGTDSPGFGVGTDSPGFGVEPAFDPTVLSLMLDHRSCRRFLPERLDDDLLDVVLAAAFSTPSKSDLQQCSVIIVDDEERRSEIAALIPSMPWIAEASRFLLFCADSRRIRGISSRSGIPFANDHLDAVLNAAADAAMHLSSFIWAAESIGLGTCPISVVRNHIEAVSAIVELPDHVFPLAGMCVGWPERLRSLSLRLPRSVTVHRDRYDDANAVEDIADYDRRRNGDRVVELDQQLDVDKWGVADTYGWSQEKARMVARRERDQLASFLRSRSFGLD